MAKEKEKQERTAEESEEHPAEETSREREEHTRGRLPLLSLAALGVVFGDIGTSPLYALRASFTALEVTPLNVLGVLSLIFWTLIIVISLKYMTLVLRADNHGEGGTLALMALISPWRVKRARRRWLIITLGTVGAALLYGGAMITPAVTVFSAVEGLHLAAAFFSDYVLPLTVVVLIVLFVLQYRGTASIGRVFGPIMLVWFAVLAALGIYGILENPEVLKAVNPIYALRFFMANQWAGLVALGGVFLVVTGGEALYADLGHFGRKPIRLAWFFYVLPALVLNYFGQGAWLLEHPQAIENPFFHLTPEWALYPLIILATIAASIASQAVISGVFSLTRQAVQLGQWPQLTIVQTSSEESGQIYVPALNWIMLAVAVGLVIVFDSAEELAIIYGVGISAAMVITTLLLFVLLHRRWEWPPLAAAALCAGFLWVDVSFFAANIIDVPEGGWVPLLIAALIFTYMATWRRGRQLLATRLQKKTESLPALFDYLDEESPKRVEGTAVFFIQAGERETPPVLMHHVKLNRSLHESVVLLTINTAEAPMVSGKEKLEVSRLKHGFWRVQVHFGFMQSADVPAALKACASEGLDVDLDEATYYVGRHTLIPTKKAGMYLWREHLFAFMSRNAARTTQFYAIPPEQVVELGIQVEI